MNSVRKEKRVSLFRQILTIPDEQNNPGRYPGLSPRCRSSAGDECRATAFGVKDIRELAQDFSGISVDSL
jgi:hypothetical protein